LQKWDVTLAVAEVAAAMVVEVIVEAVAVAVVVPLPLPTLHHSVAAGGKGVPCITTFLPRKSFVILRYPIDLLISVLGVRRYGYWKMGRLCLHAGASAFISLKEHESWVWQFYAAGLILRL
jgi:hypothetical protein